MQFFSSDIVCTCRLVKTSQPIALRVSLFFPCLLVIVFQDCCVKVRYTERLKYPCRPVHTPSSSLDFTLQRRTLLRPSACVRRALLRNVFILRVPESNLSRLLCTDECRVFIKPLAKTPQRSTVRRDQSVRITVKYDKDKYQVVTFASRAKRRSSLF